MSKPEKTPTPREQLEMRLTALLMGQLPPEEAAALEAQVAADPALAALKARLRKAIELLREASNESEAPASETPVQLSSERRARLLAHFQTPRPKPSKTVKLTKFPQPAPTNWKRERDWSWVIPLGVAATVVALVVIGLGRSVLTKSVTDTPDFAAYAPEKESRFTIQTETAPPEQVPDLTQGQAHAYKLEPMAPPMAMAAPSAGRIASIATGSAAMPNFVPPSYVAPSKPSRMAPAIKAPAEPNPTTALAFGTASTTPAAYSDSKSADNLAATSAPAPSTIYLGRTTADVAFANAKEQAKPGFATDANGSSNNIVIDYGKTLSLTGSNTYTGSTTISGGTLTAGNSNISPGGAGGTIVSIDSGTLNVGSIASNQSAANTFGGTITMSPVPVAKDIEVSAGAPLTVSGGLNVAGVSRTKDWVIRRESVNPADNGRLAGSGGVTKEDAGKLTVNAGAPSFDTGVGNLPPTAIQENLAANNAGTTPPAGLPQAQLLQNEFQRYPSPAVPSNSPSPAAARPASSPTLGEPALEESKKMEITNNLATVQTTPALREKSRKGGTAAPAIDSKNRPNVEQVKQLFIEAQGLYDTGRYSLAKKRAEQILKVDPNNIAARRFEEKTDRAMSDYGIAAYNETRADATASTNMAWARPTRRFPAAGEETVATPEDKTATLKRKLDSIVIPKLELRNATVREAIDYLKKKSVEADGTSPAGERGANIVLKTETRDKEEAAALAAPAGSATDPRITLSLTNIPLTEALKYVTGVANLKYKVEPYAVAVVPITENTDVLITKEWKVPADLVPPTSGSDPNSPVDRETIKNWLIANGLSFNGSSSAILIKNSNRLIVRNTQDQLDLVENIVKAAAADQAAKAAKSAAVSTAPIPQPEIATSENAFSTFSLNVSDVSFKLAAASLEQGHMPDPASVRSEEFINAFNYRDPEPAPGAPLAFASERARYPFAQNRDLLRFSVKTAAAGRQAGRPLNIVLLLDKSGSMERADRVNIVHEALRILATQLQPQDKLSIVTFARTPRLWADGVAGDKVNDTIARVNEITPEGGTNLEAALDLGYETARRHFTPDSVNRVVLFTDGAANLGDVNPDALTKKVEAQRKQGIALDCFGIGWEGYNDNLLEQLTRNADGRYGFINTPEDAASNFATQLAGALQVAASDVKVQVEFNPRRVKAYRQIGYATHQLTKEQFRDNTVNAAQIGAAESGNALYVVEIDPRGEGDLATVHVRFRVPGTSDYREHEWPVPFTGEAQPLEQSSSALRLAGAASAFSEMLAASPYATEVTSDRLLNILNGVPPIYGADPRPTKLEWMIRQARSLSGR